MKKRLIAILLVVALVFASVAVLTACQDNEFTITFRRQGRAVFTMKTSDGKLTRERVEAEQAKYMKQIDNRQNEGYFFTGWYETVRTVQGEYIYEDAINYNRKYTKDVDYEAGWEFAPLAGEEEGYTLIGIINGTTNWQPLETPDEWILEQDPVETWLYKRTIDIAGRDEIKIKTYHVDWDEGEINYGFTRLGDITAAQDVEVPAGVEGKGSSNDGSCFFYGNASNDQCNIFVSAHIESANVTFTYNFRAKKVDIEFNSLVWLDEIPDPEYILVGGHKLAGDTGSGDSPEWSEQTDNEARIFSAVEGEDNLRKLYFEFNENDAFKVKENCTGWAYEIGAGSIDEVTFEAGVPVVEGLFGSNGSNIAVKYECKVEITLHVMERKLSVHVLYVNTNKTQLTYIVAGNFANNSWNVSSALPGYTFTEVAGATGKYELTITIPQNTSWKVSAIPGGWNAFELGMGAIRNFTKEDTVAADVTLDSTFSGSKTDEKGNILAKRECNITITVDEIANKIDIHVNSAKDPVEIDDRWIIAGSMNNWPDGSFSGSDMYVFKAKDGDENILELTISLAADSSFKFKQVYTWTGEKNWSHLGTVTGASSSIDVTGLFTGSGESNIGVTKACNVTFTLNLTTGMITVLVNSIG